MLFPPLLLIFSKWRGTFISLAYDEVKNRFLRRGLCLYLKFRILFSAFKALNFMDIQFLQSPHHTETDVIPISLYVKESRMLILLCSLNATRICSKSWLVEENDLFHY